MCSINTHINKTITNINIFSNEQMNFSCLIFVDNNWTDSINISILHLLNWFWAQNQVKVAIDILKGMWNSVLWPLFSFVRNILILVDHHNFGLLVLLLSIVIYMNICTLMFKFFVLRATHMSKETSPYFLLIQNALKQHFNLCK